MQKYLQVTGMTKVIHTKAKLIPTRDENGNVKWIAKPLPKESKTEELNSDD